MRHIRNFIIIIIPSRDITIMCIIYIYTYIIKNMYKPNKKIKKYKN